jgi:hypothetical protein
VFVTTETNGLYSNAFSELPAVAGVNDLKNALNGVITISPNRSKDNFNIQLKDIQTE